MREIDLRSDTVTRPTEGMRHAMAEAVVGDDVFGDDPTVKELEERTADLLGHEAGLYVASGTMGNLIALLSHAGRGDEIMLGHEAHTFVYEAGGSAALGSIHPHLLPNQADGTIRLEDIENAVRDSSDAHFPRSVLVTIENTHNRCGGIALSPDYTDQVSALARRLGLALHLDGARLFNAAIALNLPVSQLAKNADSVMVCLSKGLGAPIGSVLCGSREFIHEAHRLRKMVGGGMRQVGILAAAGLYALDHHIERLAEDHRNAERLIKGISEIPGLVAPQAKPADTSWTNLVYFSVNGEEIDQPNLDAAVIAERLRAHGVLAIALGKSQRRMRMATHLDVRSEDIDTVLDALQSAVERT